MDLPGVWQREDFEFVIKSFQQRSKVAGRMELKGKMLNWWAGKGSKSCHKDGASKKPEIFKMG